MSQEQLSGKRAVLIVDDDEGLRRLIEKKVRRAGFETDSVGTGEEAIASVQKDPAQLLLLDQRLPDSSGRAIIEKRHDELNIPVPFIMMTGQGDERLAVEMMKLGAADYLVKDTELVDRLPNALDRVFKTIETEEKLRIVEAEKNLLKEQLTQSQKMESVGRLAGGVAHDFNNMLGAIIGNAELALDEIPDNDPIHVYLEEICSVAQRSADLTRQLLAFARKQIIKPVVLNVNDVIKALLGMLKRLIRETITIEWTPAENPHNVFIDPTQIDQIIINLCVNARDAISGPGTITLSTGNVRLDESELLVNPDRRAGDFMRISVTDTGSGIEKEVANQLFEPFFTTKGQGKGTGLGLSMIYGVVHQNSGWIEIESELGKGSTFHIFLPASDKQSEKASENHLNDEKGEGKILLVEDEETLLKTTYILLKNMGYTVFSLTSAEEALNHNEPVDLLITDILMPGMNGNALAEKLKERNPSLKVLLMSGYTSDVIGIDDINKDSVSFIQKPFNKEKLAKKVKEVLGKA